MVWTKSSVLDLTPKFEKRIIELFLGGERETKKRETKALFGTLLPHAIQIIHEIHYGLIHRGGVSLAIAQLSSNRKLMLRMYSTYTWYQSDLFVPLIPYHPV